MFSGTVDILNTPFYKHLFFDAYVVKEEGYITEINCEIFSKYLKKEKINNNFTEQFNKGLYENYNVRYDFSYDELLLKIVLNPLLFKKYNNFILLSGYGVNHTGHAVNFFIEKQSDESYTLSIINSGEGIEKYHIIEKKEVDKTLLGGNKIRGNPSSKYSVMMQYKNVTFDTIIKLIRFTYLICNPMVRVELKKFIYWMYDYNYDYENDTFDTYYFSGVEDEAKINPLTKKQFYRTTRMENLKKIIKSELSYMSILCKDKYLKKLAERGKFVEESEYDDLESFKNLVLKKELCEFIEKDFSFISEFLHPDSDFNVIDNIVSIDVFYSYVMHLIPNFKTPDVHITDEPQESGSCTFYATYYTLKFFFFPDDDSFNIFINKIKLDLLTHLKTTLSLDPSTNPDINLFNSGLLLIKDYTENEQFADIILEIKKIMCGLLENNFMKYTELPLIPQNGKKIYIHRIYARDEYEEFIRYMNKLKVDFDMYDLFNNYLYIVKIVLNVASSHSSDEIDFILMPYMFHKVSILFINIIKKKKITTENEFLNFFYYIKLMCQIFYKIKKTRALVLNLLLLNIKIKLFNSFLMMLKDFDLIVLSDSTENIFGEPSVIKKKQKILEFLSNGYIYNYDYDIDFTELLENLDNKFDLLVINRYFNYYLNNGEFLYLLGFDDNMTLYYESTKYDSIAPSGGDDPPYGFDFEKNYNVFADIYTKKGEDIYNDIKFNNMGEKITNKMHIKIHNIALPTYDYDNLTELNELIDSINSSDIQLILTHSTYLIYNKGILRNLVLHKCISDDLFYKKNNSEYLGLIKTGNTDTSIIIPSIIAKLNINKFIEYMSLMSENCIDTIAFLIYKYRPADYDKYKVNDLLSDTSFFKIISSDNKQIYKIFFYNYSCRENIDFGKDINKFIIDKNKVSKCLDYSFYSFMHYILEYVGFENINDTVLFNSVQQVLNEYSSKSKIETNYNLMDAEFFDYKVLIYEDNTSKETYYKTNTQKNMCKFVIDDESRSYSKYFMLNNFYYIKDVNGHMPDKLQFFIRNLSSVSLTLLWVAIHIKCWIVELIDFDKILQFYYDASDRNIYFNEDGNKYKVETEYNKLLGLLVFNSPNMLIISKDNKYFILLLNSRNYYKNCIEEYEKEKYTYWSVPKRDDTTISNSYHILEINYNLLTFNIKSDEYIKLMYSFIKNKNNYGIFLIKDNYKNIIKNIDKDTNKPSYFSYLDVPFVKLYKDKYSKIGTFNKNFNYQDISTLLFNDFKIELDLYNEKNISIIKSISDKINLIKNKEYGKAQTKIIGENKDLKSYIDNFRANCKNDYNQLKNSINRLSITTNPNANVYEDTLFDELTCKKTIHSFPSLYVKKYNIFYNMIISNLYNACINNLKKLSVFNCEQLLKIIMFLDYGEIYPINKVRKIEDVIFEIHSNYFIKQEQKILVRNNILTDLSSNDNNKVYEILMGKGKTTTITPLTLINQIFTTCIKNYNIILPKHLAPSSFDIITSYSQIFYNYKINNGIKTNFKNDNIISIISDVELKEFVLKKIIESDKIQNIFNQNNLFIFDEIDTLIDSNKSELNIPTEDYPHEYSNLIFNNIINIVIHYYENNEVDMDKIIINDTVEPSDSTIITSFTEKMKKIFEIVKRMIYNQNYGFGKLKYDYAEKTKEIEEIEEIQEIEEIEVIQSIEEIERIENDKSNFIAVPYSANNAPINGSEFTDFELAITLTILSYLNNGLRTIDLFIIFKNFNKILKKNIELKILLPDFITEKMLNDIIKTSRLKIKDFFQWCNSNIDTYTKNIDTYSKNKDMIIYYLRTIVLQNYFKISSEQYNISMIDLLDHNICNKKILFSGTVNFYLLSDISKIVVENNKDFNKIYPEFNKNLLSKIISDNKSKGSIYSAIYGITTKLTKIFTFVGTPNYLQTENNFMNFILNIENLKKYDSVIDAAGLIINNSPTFVITAIYQQMLSSGIKKTLLFINESDTKMIFYSPDNIKKYNNEIFPNLFIYYDHKHTVGIDFKQPAKMHGLVSVSEASTLTQISQAIFRLRNINMGHSIDFYSDSRIFDKSETSVKTLLTKCMVNETSYKTGTKNNLQIQYLKFLKRFINKNSSVDYKEQIFYDLIKYNDRFLSQQQFINDIIIKNITESLNSNNIFIKKLDYSFSSDKISTNIQLKKQINIEMDQHIQVEINNRNKYPYKIDLLYKLVDENVTFNKLFNSDNYIIRAMDSKITFNYIKIGDWTIKFSPIIFSALYNENTFTNKDLYYIYCPKISNKITIIHYIDYFTIIKENDYALRFLSLSTEDLKKKYNFLIFDNYGNIVLDNVYDKYIIVNIPPYIQVLLFKLNLSYIDTFYYLSTLKEYIDFDIYSFLRGNLGITHNYALFTISQDLHYTNNIELIDDYSNFETWKKIFELPELTSVQRKYFEDNIIQKYINKYINHTENTMNHIFADDGDSQEYYDAEDDSSQEYYYEEYDDILPTKIIKSNKTIIVTDSIRRTKLNSKGYKDNETVLLYDNEKFLKNKLATFNAYPENIHIFRNGLKLGGSFIVKQRIFNILSYHGYTNIKLTNFTTESFTFEVKGDEKKYIINFNVGDSYREKYLKYKNKYLNLRQQYLLNNV